MSTAIDSMVNPHRVRTVPGRKTDVQDGQWLQVRPTKLPVRSIDGGLLAVPVRADDYGQRYQQRLRDNLKKKAATLGFDLVPEPAAQEVV